MRPSARAAAAVGRPVIASHSSIVAFSFGEAPEIWDSGFTMLVRIPDTSTDEADDEKPKTCSGHGVGLVTLNNLVGCQSAKNAY